MKQLLFASTLITFIQGSIMDIKIGKPAPAFSLPDETGKIRSLSEFKGKKIVIYFYPKDNTPGCTTEACNFRDASSEYAKEGIVVLGISYDSPESHKKFKEKHNLPFILLSDSDRKVAEQYGAYKNITHYLFPRRITILVDEQRNVIKILEKVNVTTHASDILKAFNLKK